MFGLGLKDIVRIAKLNGKERGNLNGNWDDAGTLGTRIILVEGALFSENRVRDYRGIYGSRGRRLHDFCALWQSWAGCCLSPLAVSGVLYDDVRRFAEGFERSDKQRKRHQAGTGTTWTGTKLIMEVSTPMHPGFTLRGAVGAKPSLPTPTLPPFSTRGVETLRRGCGAIDRFSV